MSPPSESTSSSTMVVVALILARSENSARLKCHRQTHTTNFLHFTCRAKPCVSLQSAPLLAVEMAATAALRPPRRRRRMGRGLCEASSQAWLPPCPTQSSCRWQCHCNANIGIETFFSTEATTESLYPPLAFFHLIRASKVELRL